MAIADRLKQARKRKGLSQTELAQELKIRQGTVSDWERGRTEPDFEKLTRLINFLEIDPNELFQDVVEIKKPSDLWETKVLEAARSLDGSGRRLLEYLLFSLQLAQKTKSQRNEPVSSEIQKIVDRIPFPYYPDTIVDFEPEAAAKPPVKHINRDFYLSHVSAGYGGVSLEDDAPGTISIVEDPLSQAADFVLQVSGDSMEPWINDGDLILVKRQSEIEDGDIGVFNHEGKQYVKEKRGDTLHSSNAAYEDMTINENTVCYGKVLGKAQM